MPSPAARPTRSDDRAHLATAARSAMAEVSAELGPMLQQELARLAQARAAWREGRDPGALSLAAHDLRGMGALCGAPLAGRMAASLERLLTLRAAPPALVEAHVDAVAAAVREGAAGAGDPRGGVLAESLETAVHRAFAQAARRATASSGSPPESWSILSSR